VSDQNTIVSILDQGTVLRGGKVDKESKKVTSGEEPNVLEGKPVSRRDFLKIAGVAGAAIGLGAGLGGLIAACGGNGATTTTAAGATTTTAAAAKNLVLGYSAPFLFSDYETAQQNATFAVAEASGWKTLPATNADGDSAKQNSDVRNLISAGATGLIVVANDSKAIIPALDYAKEKAVPVVAIDIGPDGGSVAMIVRANNVGMGGIAADAMAKSIGEKGTVLSLMGAQTSINGRDRSDGFRQGIAKYPNIKLIELPTDWDATKQAAAVATTLTAHPDLAGVFQQADYALAATNAVIASKGSAAKVGEPGHIYNISIDATVEGLGLVRDGIMDAEISQPLDVYAKVGMQYLTMVMNGEALPGAGPTDHSSEIVMFNGNTMDLIPAVLVTKANVDDPTLWANTVSK
jgi:ribose transport system substrate-binding protein